MPKNWNIPGDTKYNIYINNGILYFENDKEVPEIAQRELFQVLRKIVDSKYKTNQLSISLSIDWLSSGIYHQGSYETPPDVDYEFKLSAPVEYNIQYDNKKYDGMLSINASKELFRNVEQDIINKNPPDRYIHDESHFNKMLNKALML
jgi:hypothetical protein